MKISQFSKGFSLFELERIKARSRKNKGKQWLRAKNKTFPSSEKPTEIIQNYKPAEIDWCRMTNDQVVKVELKKKRIYANTLCCIV